MDFDVFISFNSSEREAAHVIARFLRDQGLKVFVDETYLTAGQNWVEALERALSSCRSVAVLLGRGGMGKWQKAEVHLALDRHQTQPLFPVVPVLLRGHDDPPTGFLALNTWIDLRQDLEDPRALANLKAAVKGLMPAEADFNPRHEVCPYRGLLPFREEDRPFFFGREAHVAELIERVRKLEHPVVPVIGRSGSGKSSLVHAGLIPALRDPRQGAPWEILTLRPRKEPLQELMAAFSPPPDDLDLAARIARLNQSAALLRQGQVRVSQLAGEILKANPGSERLLIFVDQWEELYSQLPRDLSRAERARWEAGRLLFIDSLLEATEHSPCTLVFTVRADFYDQILTHGRLTAQVDRAGLSLGPMSPQSLRDCIEKPAAAAGYRFAEGLVERILDDVGSEPGHLPLLEFLLHELWKRRSSDEFTFKGYQDAGGVSGAIAKRADQVYQRILDQGDQKLAAAVRRVFVSLVTPGEGREDTRAVIPLPAAGPERKVVEIFSAADVRLLTADNQAVEVSHEALIRQWELLRQDWLAKNRDLLRVRDRIRAARDVWDPPPTAAPPDPPAKRKRERRRSPDRLIPRGRPLEEARELLRNTGDVLIEDIEDYIRRSLRREFLRRVRGISFLLGVAVVAMLVGSVGLLLLAAGVIVFSEEEKALEDYQRKVYPRADVMPSEPPPLAQAGQARRPFISFQNGVGMEMVWCWPGSFVMGSPEEEPARDSDETPHEVTLSRGFWMTRHEVTQGQWDKLMARNPSTFRWNQNHPVERVSWHGAMIFCEELTRLEREAGALPDGWTYTLPTEAQWEYACRAGHRAPFSGASLGESGWYIGNALLHTHPAGGKQANEWGFYDMHGNVIEWCADWYDAYPPGPVTDPTGPPDGSFRVVRGGSWLNSASLCRSAFRFRNRPGYWYFNIGFRVAVSSTRPASQ